MCTGGSNVLKVDDYSQLANDMSSFVRESIFGQWKRCTTTTTTQTTTTKTKTTTTTTAAAAASGCETATVTTVTTTTTSTTECSDLDVVFMADVSRSVRQYPDKKGRICYHPKTGVNCSDTGLGITLGFIRGAIERLEGENKKVRKLGLADKIRTAFVPFALDATIALDFTANKSASTLDNMFEYRPDPKSTGSPWSDAVKRGVRSKPCLHHTSGGQGAYCGFDKSLAHDGTDFIRMARELDSVLTRANNTAGGGGTSRKTIVFVMTDGHIMDGLGENLSPSFLHPFLTANASSAAGCNFTKYVCAVHTRAVECAPLSPVVQPSERVAPVARAFATFPPRSPSVPTL